MGAAMADGSLTILVLQFGRSNIGRIYIVNGKAFGIADEQKDPGVLIH